MGDVSFQTHGGERQTRSVASGATGNSATESETNVMQIHVPTKRQQIFAASLPNQANPGMAFVKKDNLITVSDPGFKASSNKAFNYPIAGETPSPVALHHRSFNFPGIEPQPELGSNTAATTGQNGGSSARVGGTSNLDVLTGLSAPVSEQSQGANSEMASFQELHKAILTHHARQLLKSAIEYTPVVLNSQASNSEQFEPRTPGTMSAGHINHLQIRNRPAHFDRPRYKTETTHSFSDQLAQQRQDNRDVLLGISPSNNRPMRMIVSDINHGISDVPPSEPQLPGHQETFLHSHRDNIPTSISGMPLNHPISEGHDAFRISTIRVSSPVEGQQTANVERQFGSGISGQPSVRHATTINSHSRNQHFGPSNGHQIHKTETHNMVNGVHKPNAELVMISPIISQTTTRTNPQSLPSTTNPSITETAKAPKIGTITINGKGNNPTVMINDTAVTHSSSSQSAIAPGMNVYTSAGKRISPVQSPAVGNTNETISGKGNKQITPPHHPIINLHINFHQPNNQQPSRESVSQQHPVSPPAGNRFVASGQNNPPKQIGLSRMMPHPNQPMLDMNVIHNITQAVIASLIRRNQAVPVIHPQQIPSTNINTSPAAQRQQPIQSHNGVSSGTANQKPAMTLSTSSGHTAVGQAIPTMQLDVQQQQVRGHMVADSQPLTSASTRSQSGLQGQVIQNIAQQQSGPTSNSRGKVHHVDPRPTGIQTNTIGQHIGGMQQQSMMQNSPSTINSNTASTPIINQQTADKVNPVTGPQLISGNQKTTHSQRVSQSTTANVPKVPGTLKMVSTQVTNMNSRHQQQPVQHSTSSQTVVSNQQFATPLQTDVITKPKVQDPTTILTSQSAAGRHIHMPEMLQGIDAIPNLQHLALPNMPLNHPVQQQQIFQNNVGPHATSQQGHHIQTANLKQGISRVPQTVNMKQQQQHQQPHIGIVPHQSVNNQQIGNVPNQSGNTPKISNPGFSSTNTQPFHQHMGSQVRMNSLPNQSSNMARQLNTITSSTSAHTSRNSHTSPQNTRSRAGNNNLPQQTINSAQQFNSISSSPRTQTSQIMGSPNGINSLPHQNSNTAQQFNTISSPTNGRTSSQNTGSQNGMNSLPQQTSNTAQQFNTISSSTNGRTSEQNTGSQNGINSLPQHSSNTAHQFNVISSSTNGRTSAQNTGSQNGMNTLPQQSSNTAQQFETISSSTNGRTSAQNTGSQNGMNTLPQQSSNTAQQFNTISSSTNGRTSEQNTGSQNGINSLPQHSSNTAHPFNVISSSTNGQTSSQNTGSQNGINSLPQQSSNTAQQFNTISSSTNGRTSEQNTGSQNGINSLPHQNSNTAQQFNTISSSTNGRTSAQNTGSQNGINSFPQHSSNTAHLFNVISSSTNGQTSSQNTGSQNGINSLPQHSSNTAHQFNVISSSTNGQTSSQNTGSQNGINSLPQQSSNTAQQFNVISSSTNGQTSSQNTGSQNGMNTLPQQSSNTAKQFNTISSSTNGRTSAQNTGSQNGINSLPQQTSDTTKQFNSVSSSTNGRTSAQNTGSQNGINRLPQQTSNTVHQFDTISSSTNGGTSAQNSGSQNGMNSLPQQSSNTVQQFKTISSSTNGRTSAQNTGSQNGINRLPQQSGNTAHKFNVISSSTNGQTSSQNTGSQNGMNSLPQQSSNNVQQFETISSSTNGQTSSQNTGSQNGINSLPQQSSNTAKQFNTISSSTNGRTSAQNTGSQNGINSLPQQTSDTTQQFNSVSSSTNGRTSAQNSGSQNGMNSLPQQSSNNVQQFKTISSSTNGRTSAQNTGSQNGINSLPQQSSNTARQFNVISSSTNGRTSAQTSGRQNGINSLPQQSGNTARQFNIISSSTNGQTSSQNTGSQNGMNTLPQQSGNTARQFNIISSSTNGQTSSQNTGSQNGMNTLPQQSGNTARQFNIISSSTNGQTSSQNTGSQNLKNSLPQQSSHTARQFNTIPSSTNGQTTSKNTRSMTERNGLPQQSRRVTGQTVNFHSPPITQHKARTTMSQHSTQSSQPQIKAKDLLGINNNQRSGTVNKQQLQQNRQHIKSFGNQIATSQHGHQSIIQSATKDAQQTETRSSSLGKSVTQASQHVNTQSLNPSHPVNKKPQSIKTSTSQQGGQSPVNINIQPNGVLVPRQMNLANVRLPPPMNHHQTSVNQAPTAQNPNTQTQLHPQQSSQNVPLPVNQATATNQQGHAQSVQHLTFSSQTAGSQSQHGHTANLQSSQLKPSTPVARRQPSTVAQRKTLASETTGQQAMLRPILIENTVFANHMGQQMNTNPRQTINQQRNAHFTQVPQYEPVVGQSTITQSASSIASHGNTISNQPIDQQNSIKEQIQSQVSQNGKTTKSTLFQPTTGNKVNQPINQGSKMTSQTSNHGSLTNTQQTSFQAKSTGRQSQQVDLGNTISSKPTNQQNNHQHTQLSNNKGNVVNMHEQLTGNQGNTISSQSSSQERPVFGQSVIKLDQPHDHPIGSQKSNQGNQLNTITLPANEHLNTFGGQVSVNNQIIQKHNPYVQSVEKQIGQKDKLGQTISVHSPNQKNSLRVQSTGSQISQQGSQGNTVTTKTTNQNTLQTQSTKQQPSQQGNTKSAKPANLQNSVNIETGGQPAIQLNTANTNRFDVSRGHNSIITSNTHSQKNGQLPASEKMIPPPSNTLIQSSRVTLPFGQGNTITTNKSSNKAMAPTHSSGSQTKPVTQQLPISQSISMASKRGQLHINQATAQHKTGHATSQVEQQSASQSQGQTVKQIQSPSQGSIGQQSLSQITDPTGQHISSASRGQVGQQSVSKSNVKQMSGPPQGQQPQGQSTGSSGQHVTGQSPPQNRQTGHQISGHTIGQQSKHISGQATSQTAQQTSGGQGTSSSSTKSRQVVGLQLSNQETKSQSASPSKPQTGHPKPEGQHATVNPNHIDRAANLNSNSHSSGSSSLSHLPSSSIQDNILASQNIQHSSPIGWVSPIVSSINRNQPHGHSKLGQQNGHPETFQPTSIISTAQMEKSTQKNSHTTSNIAKTSTPRQKTDVIQTMQTRGLFKQAFADPVQVQTNSNTNQQDIKPVVSEHSMIPKQHKMANSKKFASTPGQKLGTQPEIVSSVPSRRSFNHNQATAQGGGGSPALSSGNTVLSDIRNSEKTAGKSVLRIGTINPIHSPIASASPGSTKGQHHTHASNTATVGRQVNTLSITQDTHLPLNSASSSTIPHVSQHNSHIPSNGIITPQHSPKNNVLPAQMGTPQSGKQNSPVTPQMKSTQKVQQSNQVTSQTRAPQNGQHNSPKLALNGQQNTPVNSKMKASQNGQQNSPETALNGQQNSPVNSQSRVSPHNQQSGPVTSQVMISQNRQGKPPMLLLRMDNETVLFLLKLWLLRQVLGNKTALLPLK
ncbi:mucin-12-like [Pecten maximus]|uniref:mucin-12-like n=1 Tax=Pecten maximus TaxID=6579 RepID=UPI001458DA86|nr:mucin-12-like [Pecten maximus]